MGQRTMHVISRLDHAGISYIKGKVISTAEQAKRVLSVTEQKRFLAWQPAGNEVLVNTGYADHALAIFGGGSRICARQSGRRVEAAYSIPYVVFRVGNYYFPYEQIELGHSHLCVLRFTEEIPDMVKQLPVFGDDRLPGSMDLSLLLQWD